MALALDETIGSILNLDIPNLYEPAQKSEAQKRFRETRQLLQEDLQRRLRTSSSLSEAHHILVCLKEILTKSRQAIESKLAEQNLFLIPHLQILGQAATEIQQINQKNILTRGLSVLLIRRLATDLKQSGQAAITGQLEAACCKISVEHFLKPLMEDVDKQIAWIGAAIHKINDIGQVSRIQAERLAGEDLTSINPNGFELTNPPYLVDYFRRYMNRQGGQTGYPKHLQEIYLQKHKTFEPLIEAAQAELIQSLEALFKPAFESEVQSSTVYDEFLRWHPDLQVQQEMVSTLIRHSEGRVLTDDGINQKVVWIKTVNVPRPACVEPVRTQLEALDKKSGQWHVVVGNDIDTLTIGQLRGQISLTPFIQRMNVPDNPEGWKASLEQAVDPVSPLIINPNPNLPQIKRVLVKAITVNALSFANGAFFLDNPPAEPIRLGNDASTVFAGIRPLWPQMVYAESLFAHKLILDEDKVLARMDQVLADLQENSGDSDPRLKLIDTDSIHECLRQIQVQLPRLRRMKKAAIRETSRP